MIIQTISICGSITIVFLIHFIIIINIKNFVYNHSTILP